MSEEIVQGVLPLLKSDLLNVFSKLKYLLHPSAYHNKLSLMKSWDLWGPLFICIVVSLAVFIRTSAEDPKLVFSLIFFLYWIGAACVSVNAKVLGWPRGFLCTLATITYAMFPLGLSICLATMTPHLGTVALVAKLILIVPGCIWTCIISARPFADEISPEKLILVQGPIILLAAALGGMCLIS